MPGADANPYLAFAAMIAAGMAGVREETRLRRGISRATPTSIRSWLACRAACAMRPIFSTQQQARAAAFGDAVVEFYVHHARLEVAGLQRRRHRLGKAPLLERIRIGGTSYTSPKHCRRKAWELVSLVHTAASTPPPSQRVELGSRIA